MRAYLRKSGRIRFGAPAFELVVRYAIDNDYLRVWPAFVELAVWEYVLVNSGNLLVVAIVIDNALGCTPGWQKCLGGGLACYSSGKLPGQHAPVIASAIELAPHLPFIDADGGGVRRLRQ